MSIHRRAARTDKNQEAIVKGLRQMGAEVWFIKEPCDLLIRYRDQFFIVEIKDGSKPPSQRKLTPQQVEFFATPCSRQAVCTNLDEAIALLTKPRSNVYAETEFEACAL